MEVSYAVKSDDKRSYGPSLNKVSGIETYPRKVQLSPSS
jgi:hypothetical protein